MGQSVRGCCLSTVPRTSEFIDLRSCGTREKLTHCRIFPIDDYYECLLRGRSKEVRFIPNKKHMGEPDSFIVILKWLYELLRLEGNPVDQARMLPFQPKY